MANEQKLREYLKRVSADLHQTRRQLQKLSGFLVRRRLPAEPRRLVCSREP